MKRFAVSWDILNSNNGTRRCMHTFESGVWRGKSSSAQLRRPREWPPIALRSTALKQSTEQIAARRDMCATTSAVLSWPKEGHPPARVRTTRTRAQSYRFPRLSRRADFFIRRELSLQIRLQIQQLQHQPVHIQEAQSQDAEPREHSREGSGRGGGWAHWGWGWMALLHGGHSHYRTTAVLVSNTESSSSEYTRGNCGGRQRRCEVWNNNGVGR